MTAAGQNPARQELATTALPAAPVAWPPGYTAAACLTFDLDAEAAVLTADIASVDRMSPMSHQAYGPLVGVPRILDLLARHVAGLGLTPRTCEQPVLPDAAYWVARPTPDHIEKGNRHGGDRA